MLNICSWLLLICLIAGSIIKLAKIIINLTFMGRQLFRTLSPSKKNYIFSGIFSKYFKIHLANIDIKTYINISIYKCQYKCHLKL